MWTIRDATPADHARIIAMSFGIQQHEHNIVGYPMLPPEETTDRYIKAIIKTATENDGEILVGEMDGETIAYLIGYPKTDEDDLVDKGFHHHAHIADLFVEPKARKQGISRALMQTFQDRMKARGCNWMRIGVQSKNELAIKAYNNFGFDPLSMYMVKKL